MRVKSYKTRAGKSYDVAELDCFAFENEQKQWALQYHYTHQVLNFDTKQWETKDVFEEKTFKSAKSMLIFVRQLGHYETRKHKKVQNFVKIWTKNIRKLLSFLPKTVRIDDVLGDKYVVIYRYYSIISELSHLSRTEIEDKDALQTIIDWHAITGKVATEKLSYQQRGRDILKDELLKQKNPKYRDGAETKRRTDLRWHNGTEYEIIDAASKGGWCNLAYDGTYIKERVRYIDAKTMYWSCLIMYQYPSKLFKFEEQLSKAKYEDYLDQGYTICCECKLTDVHLREDGVPCMRARDSLNEYRADGKKNLYTVKHGWIKKANEVVLCLTDIDLLYLASNYTFNLQMKNAFIYEMKHLSKKMIDKIIKHFCTKEEFEEDTIEYRDSKAVLNGGHGGMSMRNWQMVIGRAHRQMVDWEKMAKQSNKEVGFKVGTLQWYCWSTAYARLRVVMMAKKLGASWVYSDTDSCIYIVNDAADILVADVNRRWREELARVLKLIHSDYTIDDLHHLGEWLEKKPKDEDGNEIEFVAVKCLKQKTYGLEDSNGHLHMTMSGANGESVGKWLESHGGLEAFEEGLVIPAEIAGKKVVSYSDDGEGYIEEWKNFIVGDDETNAIYNTRHLSHI